MERLIAVTLSMLGAAQAADKPVEIRQVPLQPGLVLVSALHWDAGDRENIFTVEQKTANGVTYGWNTKQRGADGKPEEVEFRRFVRASDLEKATRLHAVYWTADKTDYPGYTGWSLSSAVYDALAAGGEAPYMIVDLGSEKEGAEAVVGNLLRQTRRLKGSLRFHSTTAQAFPLLYNGARVAVPARRATGNFVADGVTENVELWVLADRVHPLLLKMIKGGHEWQIVRIETPREQPSRSIEQQLTRNCRVEIPGVYFAFATADLDSMSDRALAAVAQTLRDHPDWTVSIEGHTDDIGSDVSNLKLSQARADAVRGNLVERQSIAAVRLKALGHGETQPRESNATLEGRARNRRVELVRPCGAG
jgi:OmpA family protein